MNTEQFFKELENDIQLQKEFTGIDRPEKFYETAVKNGLTDDFETMKAFATKQIQSFNREADINYLSNVTGGVDAFEGSMIGLSVVSAGVIMAAA